MHDVQEGVASYFLKHFIKYCNRINISEVDIIRKIRDFDYGPMSKKNKPSLVVPTKTNLGQSAVQMYCLINNLPFIMFEFHEKIGDAWKALGSFLSIMQIIYSRKISKQNISKLTDLISDHLIQVKQLFDERLIFKHHILYPTAIRKMGPPIHTTMMRMEAKHKVFTDMARKTQNFMNITKTLANRHQDYICNVKPSHYDEIKIPKKEIRNFQDSDEYLSVIDCLPNDCNLRTDHFKELKFLEINGYRYEKGLIILKQGDIFEIDHILSSNNNFYFVCTKQEFSKIDKILHSIKIKFKSDSFECIAFKDLQ